MSDYLVRAASQPMLGRVLRALGVPAPKKLERANTPFAHACLANQSVLFGSVEHGRTARKVESILTAAGADWSREPAENKDDARYDACVLDATGMASVSSVRELYAFFRPVIARVKACGRVVVIVRRPQTQNNVETMIAARAADGFIRSLAKEIGRFGSTANMLAIDGDANARLAGPLRFLLSAHSAFVDGQTIKITSDGRAPRSVPTESTLAEKVAVVTGAARGIGQAIAERLAAEGGHVVGVDVPANQQPLETLATRLGGSALTLDITEPGAGDSLADFLANRFGGVDIVVHNAGVTRSRSLANLSEADWDVVQRTNLDAVVAIDRILTEKKLVREHGRVVCLSSIVGLAGNKGQTNYATTKAGLIGFVQAKAKTARSRGICYNAVAPGFIETRMTAQMPFGLRESGRRLSSLGQGGTPQDVAEAVAFLSTPGAGGVSGNVLRVCGQSVLGA